MARACCWGGARWCRPTSPSGRLVRPFGHGIKASSKYYVVYLATALRQRKVRAFRDWLLAESDIDNGRRGSE